MLKPVRLISTIAPIGMLNLHSTLILTLEPKCDIKIAIWDNNGSVTFPGLNMAINKRPNSKSPRCQCMWWFAFAVKGPQSS